MESLSLSIEQEEINEPIQNQELFTCLSAPESKEHFVHVHGNISSTDSAYTDALFRLNKNIIRHIQSFLGNIFYRYMPSLNKAYKTLIYTGGIYCKYKYYTLCDIFPLIHNNSNLNLIQLNLYVIDDTTLISLSSCLPHIIVLHITGYDNSYLSNLHFLSICTSLKDLMIFCKVYDIHGLEYVPQLTQLSLYNICQNLDFTPLTKLRNLRQLTLDTCDEKIEQHIADFPFLEKVTLMHYAGKTPSFLNCPQLHVFILMFSKEHIILSPFDESVQMQELDIRGIGKLNIYPTFTVPLLEKLILNDVNVISHSNNLFFLKECMYLRYVRVDKLRCPCTNVLDISVIATLPRLNTFILNNSIISNTVRHQLVLPPAKEDYSGILTLDINHYDCSSFTLDYLAACPNLTFLKLDTNVPTEITVTKSCPKLQILHLGYNISVSSLDFLAECRELKEIDMKFTYLSLKRLSHCNKLVTVTLTDTTFVQDIPCTVENLTLSKSSFYSTSGLKTSYKFNIFKYR